MSEVPVSVSAWLRKADSDLDAAVHLSQFPDAYWDIIVFHAQQAVEKYLKAFLVFNGRRPPRIHELAPLLKASLEFAPQLELFDEDCRFLSPLAVVSRYPGRELDSPREDGERGIAIARRVKETIRPLITGRPAT